MQHQPYFISHGKVTYGRYEAACQYVSGCVTLHECPYRSALPSWPWVASNHLEGMFWVQLLLIFLFASDNSIIMLRKK